MESMIAGISTYSGDIDFLILLIAVMGGFWFFVAEFVLFYLIFKFRRKDGQKAQYITGEKKEEKKWIAIPHKLILICDIVVIVFAIKVWYGVKQDLPPAEQTIKVVGQQWAWTFIHPGADGKIDTDDDVAVIDELHVKVDTLYHFILSSKDVLHSFSIPVFRIKQDVVPGREITGWFKATETGEFDVQCAEMCGIGHGIMGARVHVESADQHDTWLQSKG